jgi:hypothetical protein
MNGNKLVVVCNNHGQWEDKTEEIAEYLTVSDGGQIKICYKNKPERWYSYRQERVRLLNAITSHDPTEVQLRIKGQVLHDVWAITKYPDFYLVISKGRRNLYSASEVSVERNVSADPACKTALDYFRAVAELGGIKNDEDESLLTKQFNRLRSISDASTLAAYLYSDAVLDETEMVKTLIYPFGTNVSQKTAVEKAFQSQVTLVQGPPGTGKTQTILNIIANAIRLGQTVAVVSNNNTATENVVNKLEGQGLGFLLATLGRRANKDAFLEAQGDYPEWVKQPSDKELVVSDLEQEFESLTTLLEELIQASNDRAMLVTRIAQIQAEFDLHRRIDGALASPEARALLNGRSSHGWLKLLIECEDSDPNVRAGLLRRLWEVLRYGYFGRKRRYRLLSEGPMALRSLYYEKSLLELRGQLSEVERVLTENCFQDIQQQVQSVSWKLLRTTIAERFQKRDARTRFTWQDLQKKYASVLEEYPVVFSTTHSIKTSLAPDCLYDLIIVDEASQVDVATGALALSCARRAVIVGDEKQLPNVIGKDVERCALELWDKFSLDCPAWNYAAHSLLTSAAARWPRAPNVLLKEHYRCHPRIAGFFNQRFYDNQLIIMTSDQGEPDAMQIVFTVPGNHARGRVNRRQIDVIQQEVLPDLVCRGMTNIGVITPYQDQVAALRRCLGNNIEVGTVHGFQGREKQAIVISTVDNEIGEFVDDPKLLNVAVSRAQRNFTVVMPAGQDNFHTNFGALARYIRRQQQLVKHSQVRSVFDLLYAEYTQARKAFLDEHGRRSEWDSENLVEVAIQDVLQSAEFARMSLSCVRHAPLAWLVGVHAGMTERERQFVLHPWSHVDFVIYDTIGKVPLLGIEVDGWVFHRPGSLQSVRDEIKNSVFQCADLHLVRLSTTGSDEVAKISEALRQTTGECVDSEPTF